ncbi:FHA domain-containing protein [Fibrisoma montanum]|uniref:FHA domain-containing protein n=1 Tax=Fibrisoma montanum TaxID=2305895 RepID=A0A418MF60_9BACT|nr:FHA domain-containing protein [Fibrisoma montanum]RIV25449.1 FHA domain-containing protein [Fibrisoma montanum]
MSADPIKIICGNSNCRAGLLIKNADKLKDAKCPRCGYINPIPRSVPPAQPKPASPAGFGDETVYNGQRRNIAPVVPPTIGWLIVKDELTETQTFTMQTGTNTVGRFSKTRPSTHMVVTRDEYMSRPHCTIEVRMGRLGEPEYILRDGGLINGEWRKSTNGTYLNGKEPGLSEYDRIYLEDGDTIQIGETKLVLKTGNSVKSEQQAARAVDEMDYERTVVSFKPKNSIS